MQDRSRQKSNAISSKFIDLSHIIVDGEVTYRGLPAPKISNYLTREQSRSHYTNGVEFLISTIEMVGNTSTYVDSPFHRYRNSKDLSELPLESLANLEGIVIRADTNKSSAIMKSLFENQDLSHKAVLVHTGWDKYWNTQQYFDNNPYLPIDTVNYLIKSNVALVGIDSVNIDNISDLSRPAHTLLLEANIPIVEHLCNLESLPKHGFKFFAVPAKVKNFGTFPVRAFALLS